MSYKKESWIYESGQSTVKEFYYQLDKDNSISDLLEALSSILVEDITLEDIRIVIEDEHDPDGFYRPCIGLRANRPVTEEEKKVQDEEIRKKKLAESKKILKKMLKAYPELADEL